MIKLVAKKEYKTKRIYFLVLKVQLKLILTLWYVQELNYQEQLISNNIQTIILFPEFNCKTEFKVAFISVLRRQIKRNTHFTSKYLQRVQANGKHFLLDLWFVSNYLLTVSNN